MNDLIRTQNFGRTIEHPQWKRPASSLCYKIVRMGIREARLLFFCLVLVSVAPAYGAGQAATVSPLAARGYIVLPEPQRTELGERDFRFGPDWRLELGGVPAHDAAAGSLRDDLESRFHIAWAEAANRCDWRSFPIR